VRSCYYRVVHANFAFVLCRPQSAGNMGSAARVLKNMGFADLRLVAPAPKRQGDAAAMAVHAKDVLAAASRWPDLAPALADCSVTVGTTCRPGPYRDSAAPLRSSASELAKLARSNRVAIIFGAEDHGLTNDELKLCQRLVTIPTAAEYRSLNLAQSVAIVAYELAMALAGEQAAAVDTRSFAPAVEVDAMLERLREALLAIGFLPDSNPDHLMFALREVLGRSGLTGRELDVFNGIARHVRWVGEGGQLTLEAKRAAGKKLR
jgi:tRNA/rRNA methyltransferase